MIEIANVFVCERETHSVCQRGDEKGWNFRFEKLLYRATGSTEGQWGKRKAYYPIIVYKNENLYIFLSVYLLSRCFSCKKKTTFSYLTQNH